MEALEGREVPAVLHWTGAVSTAFDVAGNWIDGFGAPATAGPAEGDDLHFGFVTAVRPDCVGAHGFGLTDDKPDYASIRLHAGYTGTVTFRSEDNATPPDPDFETPAADRNRGVAVGRLILEGGAISQPEDATELTVHPDQYLPDPQPTFQWFAGTLNSSEFTSVVHVLGGAHVAPIFEGTVTLGSHLVLKGADGAPAESNTSTFHPGTVVFNNSADLIVGQFVNADIKAPRENADVTFSGTAGLVRSRVAVRSGGVLTVTGPGRWNGFMMPLVNQGQVEIKNGARASFGPPLPIFEEPQISYIAQYSGSLRLHAGSTLMSQFTGGYNVQLLGGNFIVVGDAGVAQPARLVGNLYFNGGALVFNEDYARLKVEGDVLWRTGVFGPRLDATDQTKSDTWEITGNLTFPADHTAQIAPDPQNIPAGGIDVTFRWESMLIGGTANAFPTVVAVGSRPQMHIFAATEGGVRHWRLGKAP